MTMRAAKSIRSALILLASLTCFAVWANPIALAPNHPERYTVKEGDTLWHIASRFLEDPWRWPEIWKQNDSIKNPHLIFPGDVLVLTQVDGHPEVRLLRSEKLGSDSGGRKTVKLSPAIYSEAREKAIPTIPPNVIHAFLTAPLVVGRNELDSAPHITVGTDGTIILGKLSSFYARGLSDPKQEYYRIFRPGVAFIDPETKEALGFEAEHLGDAKLQRFDKVSKLRIIKSYKEISPGDRLSPAPDDITLPYYTPRKPSREVRGRILKAAATVAELGALTVVVVSLGKRDDIEDGHVLRILRQATKTKDPTKGDIYETPTEQIGLMMVFRTFDKVSYALVLKSTESIHILDVVETP